MSKFFVISAFVVATAMFARAQTNVDFNKANFKGKETQLKMAKKNIKDADIYVFDENNWAKGLELYLKAYELNPDNAELNFKIGLCYYNTSPQHDCLKYFEKAQALNPDVDKKIDFYLARAYHLNYHFDEAIKFYNSYNAKTKQKEAAVIGKFFQECNSGKDIMHDTTEVEIVNLGANINTEYKEYGPFVSADGSRLFFTSRRKGSTGNIVAEDGLYYEDIYSAKYSNDKWQKAKNAGSPLNTKDHDAIVGLSPDGETMFVYVHQNGGDIYVSHLKGSRWTKPENISENINTKYHESKACISYDNKTLYFISDNPTTSVGGKDIFFSVKNGDQWSMPVNLGDNINTPYDEVDIFFHPDGRTMFFSSNGHNTMGGFDIFKSVKDENGLWGKPVNLGYPINTTGDDVFYVTTASGKRAFFVSQRAGGYGQHDLYELRFPEKKKDSVVAIEDRFLVTLVKGVVRDATTKSPLEAKIEIIDNKNNEVIAEFTSNSQTGAYLVNLPSGKNYGLNVNKQHYLFHSENFDLADTADFQEVVIDIDLQRIEVGKSIVLKNIFFDFDKATLRPESYAELNRVASILKQNPKLKIEIGGHTDNKGAVEYNTRLSTNRAKTVVDYLIRIGIDSARLSFKGYAFSKPIATNDTDEGRQLNRRVEFKILSN